MMQNKENTKKTEVKTNEEKEIKEAVVRVLWNGMHMTYQEYREAIEAERN